jgi:Flp pilus assembly protein TadB
MAMIASSGALLAIVVGAVAGAGVFLLIVAIRGLPAKPAGARTGRLEAELRQLFGVRGVIALGAGLLTLVVTGWVVAGIGAALLAFAWRGLGGAAGERKATARLEALAMWTESLRDTIAGAVGLEQAIPASLRAAAPAIHGPLERMTGRLQTRMPLTDALGRFADDLNDPSADLIIAALAINARLRGPGLRDLLSALAASVREELDMRRKVTADRSATRRSVQIVVAVSVGLVLVMGIFNRGYVAPYNSAVGQLVLVIVVVLYAISFIWLRSLARFKTPERLLSLTPPVSAPAAMPETVTAWQGGAE